MHDVILDLQGLIDNYCYEFWKSILEDFFHYFLQHLRRNISTPNLCQLKNLLIGQKTTINYVDIGFSCKVFFVLGMLNTFFQFLDYFLRSHHSPSSKLKVKQETELEPKKRYTQKKNTNQNIRQSLEQSSTQIQS